jgi:hypothetical protein
MTKNNDAAQPFKKGLGLKSLAEVQLEEPILNFCYILHSA